MKNLFLFTTALNGTRFTIKVLPGQNLEAGLAKDIDDVKITGPIPALTKYAVGVTFVATDYDVHGGEHIHINKCDLLLDLNKTFTSDALKKDGATLDADSQKIFNYTIEYLLEDENCTEENLKKTLEAFEKDFGIKFSIEDFKKDLEKKMGVKTNYKKVIRKSYPAPKEEDTGFYIDPDNWDLFIRNVLKNENTMVIGPTGSGKTEVITLVAKTLGLDLNIQDMGTVQDAQSALLGVHRLNKEGHSVFDPAPFVGHVQKKGLILLDELNRAPLAANNILFPCLDRRRYLPLDIASSDEERFVPVHEEAVFFATANLGSEYSGTFQIDRALYDRFMPIEMDYPKEDAEARILTLRTGVDAKVAKSIVKCCATIRRQYRESELSNTVSVRHSLQIASLISDGFKSDQAMFAVLLPLFEDSLSANSERSKIKSIVAAF